MFPTVGIDATALNEVEGNALAVLVNLDLADLAALKHLMHLGDPAVVGMTTLQDFAILAAAHHFDLTDAGVGAFKQAHGLDNSGDNAGAIGPTTAKAYARALLAAVPAPGAPGRHATDRGRRVIENFEGLVLHAYQDQVGIWTIGYGHTAGVEPGQTITQAQADEFLREDMSWAENAVATGVTVALNDNQFDALVSLVFNIGAAGFRGSTLRRLLNAGDYQGAADQFSAWCHGGGGTIPALVSRRAEERELFLRPVA